MRYVFFESSTFTRLRPGYLDDDELRELQYALMRKPESGPLIPGTGGFRKLRWTDRRRGKGKRGGLRVIYYLQGAERQIWLFAIFDKDELEDLTREQCQLLRNAIRAELSIRRARS